MKKIIQFVTLSLLVFVVASCSQSSAAIDKAYQEACKASSAEEVATTLCNGDIKVNNLSSEEFTKLGAVLGYITYTGLYSSNFEAQVDMYQFGNLLDEYRTKEQTLSDSEKTQILDLTKQILVSVNGTNAK